MRALNLILAGLLSCGPCSAAKLELISPPGSVEFGRKLLALPDGRVVVADPGYDLPDTLDVGAVHLFDASGALSSSLIGTQLRDRVGSGLQLLSGGGFVVISPAWQGGLGAISVVRSGQELPGTISSGNSLIEGSGVSRIGSLGVVELDNGNLVVLSTGGRGAATLIKLSDST